MSTFTRPLRLYSKDGALSRSVEALVDTGASYAMVPAALLNELGITPEDEAPFRLGDERLRVWPVAQLEVELEGNRTYTWCIFGDPDSQPIIGAYTLEGARLMVNPIHEELVPLIGLLKWRRPL